MEVNLEYGRVFERTIASDKRIRINRGGTRAGKSYALAQMYILDLFTIEEKPKILSIVRKTFPALKATVMRDVVDILKDTGLYDLVLHHKTDSYILFPATGRNQNMIEFFALDNQQKVRGRKRTKLWINEANEISFEDFRQLAFRTTGTIDIDFNPDDENVWINTELEQKRAHLEGYKDVEVIVSTYKDNPFLDESTIKEIELLQLTDESYWQIFGMGEYGKVRGLIFSNYAVCEDIPGEAKFIGYGLDFGFTNDPTAVVAVYMQNGELWLKEILYQRGLTNPQIRDALVAAGVGLRDTIVADSAEPKSIEEIYSMGLRGIEGAKKGADSILASIDVLRRYKLNITAESTNLLREIKRYKWKVDKNGIVQNEPVDFDNHIVDGLRYIALNKIQPVQPRGGVMKIRTRID